MNYFVVVVVESVVEVVWVVDEVMNVLNEGQLVVNSIVCSIQLLVKNVDDSVQVICKLENDFNQVGVVLDVIKGIVE